MSINHDALKKSLNIVARNPEKVIEAQKKYKDRLAEIKAKEANGNWSPNAIKRMREEAVAERNRVCDTLVNAMRPALETIKENNDFANEPFDIENPKLQNAVNMLQYIDKTSYADLVSVVEKFRGDPGSLRFLKKAFEKTGMNWAAKNLVEPMMKNVDHYAIEQMEEVIAYYNFARSGNGFDFPMAKCWKHGEFERAISRLGYDADFRDPYSAALYDAADSFCSQIMDERTKGTYKFIAQQASHQIQEGADAVSTFNKAIELMEMKAAKMAEAQAE